MAIKKKATARGGQPKASLQSQVSALEALAGLTELDEAAAVGVNGGLSAAIKPIVRPIKLKRGTGAIAVRRGTGAIPAIIGGGTGALRIKGTGAIAKPFPGA
jgi:hypothetical protein